MIRIETWVKQPAGFFDVTLLQDGRRHTYQLRSERDFRNFLNLIKYGRYSEAFSLVSSATPAEARGANLPLEGRERPNPVGENAKTDAGVRVPETGWLWPEASQMIASADNRMVMPYPF